MATKKKEPEDQDDTETPEPVAARDDVEVDLSEPEPDDDPDVEIEQPNGVPSRREKKAARGRRFEEVDQRLTLAEQRAEAAERRANEAVAWAQQMGGQRQQQEDPLETYSKNVERAERGLLAEFEAARSSGKMTPEQHQEFIRRGNEVQEAKYDVFYKKKQRSEAPTPQQQQNANDILQFRTKYPDISADPRFLTDCDGNYRRMVARGAPQGWDTIDKAAAETRAHFKLSNGNGHRAPSPAMRQKLAGSPVGASSGGGEAPTIRLSVEQQEMALAAFPELAKSKGDGAAYKHFAKEVVLKRTMARQKNA